MEELDEQPILLFLFLYFLYYFLNPFTVYILNPFLHIFIIIVLNEILAQDSLKYMI